MTQSTAEGKTAGDGYPMMRGIMQEARAVEWNQTDMTRAGSLLPISRIETKAKAAQSAEMMPNTVPCGEMRTAVFVTDE